MKNGRMALCLAGGYLLGRFHKMRWALGLAGVAAGRRLRGSGGGALAEVLKAPALDQLQHLRGELLAAGRTAAVAMAGNRIDALSDRLQERAASLRTGPSGERPEAGEAEEAEEAEEGEGGGEREPRREQRGSGDGGRGGVERDREITRRRAERLHARSSGGTRRTTQTSRGTRRTAGSERSGGRSGREESTAGESSRRSRG